MGSEKELGDAPSHADPSRPWENEPDEKAWVDEATGLACLAMRGPHGGWCGYVAVPADHPANGMDYYSSSFDIEDLLSGQKTRATAEAKLAVNKIEVHGGLTFASRERNHPDAPAGAWWFGFDCAHAGDFSPKMDRVDHPITGLGCPTGWGGVVTYRTLGYVVDQCADLARQLQAMAPQKATQDGSSPQKDHPHAD